MAKRNRATPVILDEVTGARQHRAALEKVKRKRHVPKCTPSLCHRGTDGRIPSYLSRCEYGRDGDCQWGIPSEVHKYCVFEFVRQNPEGATLQDVGAAFGLSRERVRQIEERVLCWAKIGTYIKVYGYAAVNRMADDPDKAAELLTVYSE